MGIARDVLVAGARAWVDRVALYCLDTPGRAAMAERVANQPDHPVTRAVLAAVEADRLTGWADAV